MTNNNHDLLRILLIESDPAKASRLLNIFHTKELKKLFSIEWVHTAREAFQKIEQIKLDVAMLEVSMGEEAGLSSFLRLHEYAPNLPIITIIEDAHKSEALSLVQKGAQGYLLESQLQKETLPRYLMRIIQSHASQKALRESEEQFRLLIENATDIITTVEPSGVISYVSPSTKHILNYHHSEITQRNVMDFIHRDDRPAFMDTFEKAFSDGGHLPNIQFRFKHQKGHWLHMEGKGRIVKDRSGQNVCVINSHDVSHRVELEKKLWALSLRDEMTGLHNRRSFMNILEQHLKLRTRSKHGFLALLFIDLDGFKQINDTLGHKMGDKALIAASKLLTNTFRDADVVARLGGDEFVVPLSDSSHEIHIDILKKRLTDNLEEWNNKEERPYKLALSVGISHHNLEKKVSAEVLLSQADQLMYEQKKKRKQKAAELETR